MLKLKWLLAVMVLIHWAAVAGAQQDSGKILVTDLLNIKTLGAVDLSPDGKRVLFTVQSILPDKERKNDYRYETQLWLADVNGTAAPRQLTFSSSGVSQPVFSPDGQSIAFVRPVDGKPQLFLLSLAGGEPRQLTELPHGAGGPQWSSDGNRLLFTSRLPLETVFKDSLINPDGDVPEWMDEKPGFGEHEYLQADTTVVPDPNGTVDQIRAYLRKNEADKKAKVLTKLDFQTETGTSADIHFSHLFVIEARAGAQPKAITRGYYSYGNPQFLGTDRVVASKDIEGRLHPDRVQESRIVSIRIDDGAEEELIIMPGHRLSVGAASPNGKWLAYQAAGIGKPSVPELHVVPVERPEDSREIVFDRNKGDIQWSDDGRFLYFTSPSNGGTVLCRAEVAGGKVEQLTSVDEGIGDYDLGHGRVVYTKTSIQNPSELFVSTDLLKKDSERLTGFNESWLKGKRLSIPEKHIFTNEEGMDIEYWIMKPIGYQSGSKYPLLLEIHGGPSAMWGPGEASMWHEFQYFCAQGYGVVYSNPRGSGGYGEKFLRANMDDWGAGPASDVLTALDKAVEEGWADTSKLVITGGSYAGYLVSWIIAHDHRFKAACSQRGVYDLNTFFGEGNAWRLVPNYFGGYPWEDGIEEKLKKESPITYVDQIKTPYIIFHGEKDLRTGVIQSEMLYKSLKVLGRPVEYVRHPEASHEITRSGDNRQRIDQMLRTYEFFERWIR